MDIAEGSFVKEDGVYGLSLFGSEPLDVAAVSVAVNDFELECVAAPCRFEPNLDGRGSYVVDLSFRGEGRLFKFSFGLARICLELELEGCPEPLAARTQDIPCLSTHVDQEERIEAMLAALFDSEGGPAIEWMFSAEIEKADAAACERGIREDSTMPFESFLDVIDGALDAYERNRAYFLGNARSRVTRASRVVPGSAVRRLGNREVRWIARNAGQLGRARPGEGLRFEGRSYAPRVVETERLVKSYGTDENVAVLGFLGTLVSKLSAMAGALEGDIQDIARLVEGLAPKREEGYSLPALCVLKIGARRKRSLLDKASSLLAHGRELLAAYRRALPGVEEVRLLKLPARSKVFQEVPGYADLFAQMEIYWSNNEFKIMSRESAALHALRLDKLYEYYALMRLLDGLAKRGFGESGRHERPIYRATYSLSAPNYSDEKRVATVYHLANATGQSVDLYYQPVVYGSDIEEHGITLHRVTPRRIFSTDGARVDDSRWDSYYTPDFLLVVKGEGARRCAILDAKFRSSYSVVNEGEAQKEADSSTSTFKAAVMKYGFEIMDAETLERVSAVWLLCGSEKKANLLRPFEQSGWMEKHGPATRSGVVALTPRTDTGLSRLLDILGIDDGSAMEEPIVSQEEEEARPASNETVTAVETFEAEPARSVFDGVEEEGGEVRTALARAFERALSEQGGAQGEKPASEEAPHREAPAPLEKPKKNRREKRQKAERKKPAPPRRGVSQSVDFEEALELVTVLVMSLVDRSDLYQADFCRRQLKLDQPLLRDEVSAKQEKAYRKVSLGEGSQVYLYAQWRPHQLISLRKYAASLRG